MMMKTSYKTVLAFGMMAAFAAPTFAQGQGRGGMGGMGGGLNLIANPSVQKELKLDEDQVRKAGVVAEDARAKMTEMRSALEGLEQDARQKKMTEMMKTANEEGIKTLGTFLKPEQVKRFKQIELQQRGLAAFNDPAIASALKITDEQKEKVMALAADQRSQMAAATEAANGDRQAANQKMMGVRKETLTKALALMTPAQTAAWKEMTGEHFELVQGPRPAR